ncbi:MAG: iron ABC transporter permease [archaeon]|nr:iron ABC transporter permease [archaeon]
MSTTSEVGRLYTKGRARKVLAILSALIALLTTVVVSVSLGAASPGFMEAMQAILSRIFPFAGIDPGSKITQTIIFELRFPRIVLAIIAGAGLAISGATTQGVLRNPLVSPYILGIASAAGFGAALTIAFGIGVVQYGEYVTVVSAFIFGMLALVMVYGVARLRGITPESVILAGVAVGYLFSAMLSIIQYIAPEHAAVRAVVYWLMGGLFTATWENILIILPIVLVTIALMMRYSWDMNVMSSGEEAAMSLGVNSRQVLVICMALGTLATASIISFTGVIGFICLVSPHIARMMIGSDHRFLLPYSSVIGGFLLLCSDTLARLVLKPSEVPVGIVTSLIGVPFFLYLLLSRRRQFWH